MHDFTARLIHDERMAEYERDGDTFRLATAARQRGSGPRRQRGGQLLRLASGRLLPAVVIALLLAGMTLTTVLAGRSDLDRARAATARFHSLNQAIKAGYGLPPQGPLSHCISSLDDTGAMGFHYINGALLDATVDPTLPEALVYAPDAHGNLKLVALEYVVFADAWEGDHAPMLFGEMFMEIEAPNRYELPAFWALHVWIWDENPAGMFAAFNPTISCG